jgi:hypothetical protein
VMVVGLVVVVAVLVVVDAATGAHRSFAATGRNSRVPN